MFTDSPQSHSAEVSMWLDRGRHGRIHLSQVTPTKVTASQSLTLPPFDAELVVVVDGKELRSSVTVPSGFEGKRTATVLNVDHVAPF